MGKGSIYRKMVIGPPSIFALGFLILLVLFFICVVLPYFFAIMTDSYFLRSEERVELREHIRNVRLQREKLKQESAQRKRGMAGLPP